MSNLSFCVLFGLLIVGIFSFTIDKKVKSSDEQLSYTDLITSVFILMRCLPTESHLTLLLGGDYNEFLVQSYINMIPIALINETNLRFDTLWKFTLSRYSYLLFENYNFIYFLRAHRFVLVTSSQPLLRGLLQMSTNQLNMLVSLMIAIAFLVSESRNAQTNGYLNQKSATLPQKYCGKKLRNTLRIVCDDPYNSVYDNSRDKEMKMANYPFAFDSSPFGARPREMLNGPFAGRRYRREFGDSDIYKECCLNMCTRRDLSKYCT